MIQIIGEDQDVIIPDKGVIQGVGVNHQRDEGQKDRREEMRMKMGKDLSHVKPGKILAAKGDVTRVNTPAII